jgi:glycerophosphoryl diester phosphodiesterase
VPAGTVSLAAAPPRFLPGTLGDGLATIEQNPRERSIVRAACASPIRHSRGVRYGAAITPLAVAHRGGAGLALENTLDAFGRSYDLGIRYLETDVRLTADGIPVVFHDPSLSRIFGTRASIKRSLYAELPKEVPTLEAVLRAFPDACFTVDVKDEALVQPLSRVLNDNGAGGRICVAGAWDGVLAELARQVPDLCTAMGWRALCHFVASGKSRVLPSRRGLPQFVHVPLRLGRWPVFAENLITRAHGIGVRVLVWTVDDPATMHRLLDEGVDGIITDRPDLLREVLISRDQWPAPSSTTSDLVS